MGVRIPPGAQYKTPGRWKIFLGFSRWMAGSCEVAGVDAGGVVACCKAAAVGVCAPASGCSFAGGAVFLLQPCAYRASWSVSCHRESTSTCGIGRPSIPSRTPSRAQTSTGRPGAKAGERRVREEVDGVAVYVSWKTQTDGEAVFYNAFPARGNGVKYVNTSGNLMDIPTSHANDHLFVPVRR